MAGDKDTLQTFEFVLGDYDKNHWYWEVNEMQSHSIEVAERLVNATGDILGYYLCDLHSALFRWWSSAASSSWLA